MDLLLEVCDNFIFDKAYATLLPKSLEKYIPETPEYILKATGVISNSTALTYTPKIHQLLQPLYPVSEATRKIYGLNSNYHWFPETALSGASIFARSNALRQATSMFIVTCLFGWVLYFLTALFSFKYVYDKTNFNHPRYLKNQISMEIYQASTAIPIMVLLTVPWFLLELHGFSKLYWNVEDSTGGWWSILIQFPAFIMFTDCGIYFIHRWLHWPSVYKLLHKPHHKWIVCTPFASHAFHPVDGYLQSLPYHWYPFFFPLHKISYLVLFTFVNFWTVMIHDGEYMSNDPVVNGAACHTVHHLYFNYNYGQFTTLWDRLGGSYRQPDPELFDKEKKKDKKVWDKQTVLMDQIRRDVEGDKDFRVYETNETIKKRN
ncbi:C-5 sterol desaturase [Martiniozyma asiatica (nom. inval.)]|nr:C-5 sterol desaturase [Martiniozyma asiatica]